MRKFQKQVVGQYVVAASLLMATMTGCGGSDQTEVASTNEANGENVVAGQASPEWYRIHRRSTGGAGASQGGALGTGGTTAATGGAVGTAGSIAYDCKLCDQANDCCTAVTPAGNPSCSFSSSECSSYSSAESQKNYALYCLTFIRTVISAWQPKSPPSVCLLPN